MKVNEKYEVHICVIDMTDNISGDVYTDFWFFDHRFSNRFCPDWAQDLYDSIEEAMHDFAISGISGIKRLFIVLSYGICYNILTKKDFLYG